MKFHKSHNLLTVDQWLQSGVGWQCRYNLKVSNKKIFSKIGHEPSEIEDTKSCGSVFPDPVGSAARTWRFSFPLVMAVSMSA